MNPGRRGRAAAPLEALLLLADDRHLVVERPRVVGPDLRPEPVLERRDDSAAARVVLGVRAGDDEQVERQADREAAVWTSRSSRMFSRPTWIRSARSGSSLIAKIRGSREGSGRSEGSARR